MLDYRHLKNMTDAIGLLQFSNLSTPDVKSGYTLDDNARALLIVLDMDDEYELALRYTRFLSDAQRPDGTWCNLLIDNRYSARCNSEDSIGRALLACGMGTWSKWTDIRNQCENMLQRHLVRTIDFRSPRAMAYALLALCKCLYPERYDAKMILRSHLAENLISLYRRNHRHNWYWFENYLTYCNGILPQALFSFAAISGDKKALKIAQDSLNFLNGILFRNGYLDIIGNDGWYTQGGAIPRFDQQPVDAASVIFACHEAYLASGKGEYRELSLRGYQWYQGANVHGIPLLDPMTGGCFDALTPHGVNLNQGAEAVLSLILSTMLLEDLLGKKSGEVKNLASG